jgi:hypothetical protein
MEKITASMGPDAQWIQTKSPGPGNEFELRSGRSLFGKLKWKKLLGSLATATTAGDKWTFKRTGFFRPIVTARIPKSDQNVAIFNPTGLGSDGTLEMMSGSTFKWTTTDSWHSKWGFKDEAGEDIIVFEPVWSMVKPMAKVQIVQDRAEIPFLVNLGMYILVLMNGESYPFFNRFTQR